MESETPRDSRTRGDWFAELFFQKIISLKSVSPRSLINKLQSKRLAITKDETSTDTLSGGDRDKSLVVARIKAATRDIIEE